MEPHRIALCVVAVFAFRSFIQFANKTYQDYFVSLACLVVGGAVGWYFLSKPKDSHDEFVENYFKKQAKTAKLAPELPKKRKSALPKKAAKFMPSASEQAAIDEAARRSVDDQMDGYLSKKKKTSTGGRMADHTTIQRKSRKKQQADLLAAQAAKAAALGGGDKPAKSVYQGRRKKAAPTKTIRAAELSAAEKKTQ